MDLASNPYAMQFNQNLGFENWQRYAGNTNKETGKFEFGPQRTAVAPPVFAEAPMKNQPDYSIQSVAPISPVGVKPQSGFGGQSPQFSVSQPKSIMDAVNQHIGE